MPIFAMSVFLLPRNTCDSIEKIMNRFWWENGGNSGRGIHWASWLRLAVPKKCDGMGFKRLHEFNVALVAKQGWRILSKPFSLVSQILKEKYFPKVCFLDSQVGHNPRYLWRSIHAGQAILREGVIRRIGDGTDTLIWGRPWVADASNGALRTPCVEELREAKVSNLMTPDGEWDLDVIQDLFLEPDIVRILNTPISPQHRDAWCWYHDMKGVYSVKHGY
ncbi:PREDICTED: uncharacterized protein LOC109158585 [Ipomoea nil]|uniref:uncharacterized protein LOC109158585 n=1 Tax=Ipomoea nil TaxID=35883 RepID=UPI000901C1DC|nr:PREDICTED: uncharacterized protein LOC109158585 [Ipomoea nil]